MARPLQTARLQQAIKVNGVQGQLISTTPLKPSGDLWSCYVIRDAQAWSVFEGRLSDCRDYAHAAGYDGILLKMPSVPWANLAN
jgi:hypothetical protein